MSKKQTYAYPSSGDFGPHVQKGMTLRDYFAGQALVAILTNDTILNGMSDVLAEKGLPFNTGNVQRQIAHAAYSLADKMLEIRDV